VQTVTWHTVRVFLHVLGATVWVGGQITLAFLVPTVRAHGVDATRAVARRFQLVAWPAFVLLLGTGIWNLFALRVGDRSREWLVTLAVKLGLVAVSGAAAAAHALLTGPRASAAAATLPPGQARRRRALSGMTAGVGLLAALAAAFFGALL
jgi:putative copper export protein